MDARPWLAVTKEQALRFFFEHLRDVSEDGDIAEPELIYNASVLAHFAMTSLASREFPSCVASLTTVFDLFVMDRSTHIDPEIAEAAGAQCLLLTGFFHDQMCRRHNMRWYSHLGAGFYYQAACFSQNPAHIKMMTRMSEHFAFWRQRQARLARELHDRPKLTEGFRS